MTDRDADLERIRATYRDYRTQGRDRLWNLTNRGYARLVAERDRALASLLHKSTPANGRILDAGCGNGTLALVADHAAVPFETWTGIDLEAESVARAREAAPWARFDVASVDRMPFDDDAFDVVVASTLVSSFPTEQLSRSAASEIGRVLVPGGWLIWYDLRYANPRNPAVHGITAVDLGRLFPGWTQELSAISLLPPLARRLGVTTPLLYPLLHALPPLRSHLVGRLRRP